MKSRFVILVDTSFAYFIHVLQDDLGENLIFESKEEADLWLKDKAEPGVAYLIHEVKYD